MNKDHLDNLEAEILNGLAEIESLEARKTPALVTATSGILGGILTLNFDNANDSIDVSQNADTITVVVSDGTNTDTLTFNTSDTLHKLVINSGGGNDVVQIHD